MRADSPFLANKRVFAVPTTGIAASIKCDQNGFVYAGCSGGIEIWNSGGMLQAIVEIPGESNAEMTLTNVHPWRDTMSPPPLLPLLRLSSGDPQMFLVELDHNRLTYLVCIQVV